MARVWLHAVPTKLETETEFIKEHINQRQFDVESKLLRIAEEARCAPEVSTEPPRTIVLRKHETLANWIQTASRAERDQMARQVLSQIRTLHAAGICHRDMKLSDIVVDGDVPLFVDFELGTDVDPKRRCYDLYGPSRDVALPEVHQAIRLLEGVWWDSATLGLRRTWPGLPNWREIDA